VTISNTFLDYPDKESHALIVYFSGCDLSCKGCHNIEMKDYQEKKLTPPKLYQTLLKESKRQGNTNKLVLSGGDPLGENNIHYTETLLSLNTFFKVCIYTGQDKIPQSIKDLSNKWTFIKIGCYNEDLKQEALKTEEFMQLASSNQKIISNDLEIRTEQGRLYYV